MQDLDGRAWPTCEAGCANTGPSVGREGRSADADLARRRIVREPLVVAHTGMLANAQYGLPRGHLAGRKALNATPNNE